jgi:hypothetical protein
MFSPFKSKVLYRVPNHYITVFGVFQDLRGNEVKYSADAECEIISLWEIVKYLTPFDVK